jgi:hypothetical protein
MTRPHLVHSEVILRQCASDPHGQQPVVSQRIEKGVCGEGRIFRIGRGLLALPDVSLMVSSSPYKILMARAASNTMIVSEVGAWSIINSLAQRESTGTSVGDNAVLVLNGRKR